MARDRMDEVMLPGDPEGLLQAVKGTERRAGKGIQYYLALSVAVAEDGTVTVRRLKMDPSSRRVIPEHLDSIEPRYAASLSPEELLRHWSHEMVLESLDTPL